MQVFKERSFELSTYSLKTLLNKGKGGVVAHYMSNEEVMLKLYAYLIRGEHSEPVLKLRYWNEVTQKVVQEISLSCTSCNYGGSRWWFNCPFCHKRVVKLYSPFSKFGIDLFSCRECSFLNYRSKSFSRGLISSCHRLEDRIGTMEEAMKRWYYRGKPTKKHSRLLKMYGRLEDLDNKWMFKVSRKLKLLV